MNIIMSDPVHSGSQIYQHILRSNQVRNDDVGVDQLEEELQQVMSQKAQLNDAIANIANQPRARPRR